MSVDRTNRNTALASALVEELARCGVRHAAIAPGSRSTPVALALWRHPELEAIVHPDERSCGFLALGAAQASGAPAVVACTSGSAAANLHPAVVEADEAAVSLIVLTSDRPPELRGIGAGQTIDQLKLYGSAVRWFCDVGTHDADDAGLIHMRSTGCRAFAAALGEPRPGPVHLNLAWREPLGPELREDDVAATSALGLDGRDGSPLTAVAPAAGRAPADDQLDELAAALATAPRGVIVCGRRPEADAAAIAALAANAGYPILAEPTSQLRLGAHDRELVVWPYDSIARSRPAGLEPELVLRFGDMPTSKPLRQWLAAVEGLREIVVDPVYGWNVPNRVTSLLVRAAPGPTADALSSRLGRRDNATWTRAWERAATAAADAIEATLAELDRPSEPGVHAALARLYADGDLVYTASSMPIRDQEAFVPSGPARVRFLCNRGANGIDGLVSSGIGAAVAARRPTWIVLGDLCLYHDMNGLSTLGAADAPVRIVAIENRGGGIFEFLPQAELIGRDEFEALFAAPSGVEIERIAALHRIEHVRIDDLDQLADLARHTRVIAEVPVDRRENVAVHGRIAAAVAEALSSVTTS
ncbi:MAG TPA: 2-succinyl-5-enolpyruvyl-6-hydroxy-3-cyclohexene-1-carboxylic-acid synthase [Solirubrobacterales bacterium]|nr:2-succinyl-5-enolpyruvyl-6-hydroxy-3-cyclohexene-1-carboxylic-acid synthase [Solirubrobacterales bacterium]